MGESEEKEFEIEGFLDSKREASKILGFYDEARPGMVKKQIMATYKKEFVKLYYLNSLTWSPEEEKFILNWRKRMSSMELSDEDYENEFGMFFKNR